MHEEIIMAGTGGQGIMVMGQLLAHAAMLEGLEVVWFPSYGPEARGGTADCTVIISSEHIGSPITAHPDTLIGMHQFLFNRFQPSVKSGGRLIVNSSLIDPDTVRQDCQVFLVPANEIAEKNGSARTANMIMLGVYIGLTGVVAVESLIDSLPQILPPHRHEFIPMNEAAILEGVDTARSLIG